VNTTIPNRAGKFQTRIARIELAKIREIRVKTPFDFSSFRAENFFEWGEHPIAASRHPLYSWRMQLDKYKDQKQKLAGGVKLTAAELNQIEADFTPSPDEVARKAYFSYVNQGSRPGHEVQHWLEAEAQLLNKRKLTRVHGFHNQT
jgi:hypothetical protein